MDRSGLRQRLLMRLGRLWRVFCLTRVLCGNCSAWAEFPRSISFDRKLDRGRIGTRLMGRVIPLGASIGREFFSANRGNGESETVIGAGSCSASGQLLWMQV